MTREEYIKKCSEFYKLLWDNRVELSKLVDWFSVKSALEGLENLEYELSDLAE